jgi:hypothetical protein
VQAQKVRKVLGSQDGRRDGKLVVVIFDADAPLSDGQILKLRRLLGLGLGEGLIDSDMFRELM